MFKHVGGTGTWMWAILGSLCTAAAWAALIKDGFDISLYHVPAVIYQTYVKIRDPIFDLTFIWIHSSFLYKRFYFDLSTSGRRFLKSLDLW